MSGLCDKNNIQFELCRLTQRIKLKEDKIQTWAVVRWLAMVNLITYWPLIQQGTACILPLQFLGLRILCGIFGLFTSYWASSEVFLSWNILLEVEKQSSPCVLQPEFQTCCLSGPKPQTFVQVVHFLGSFFEGQIFHNSGEQTKVWVLEIFYSRGLASAEEIFLKLGKKLKSFRNLPYNQWQVLYSRVEDTMAQRWKFCEVTDYFLPCKQK